MSISLNMIVKDVEKHIADAINSVKNIIDEIIIVDNFSENCRVAYVMFDDGEMTSEDRAKFRTGRSGWQYGGKIVLLDENEQPYSVVVSRLNRMVTLEQGDILLLEPKSRDEVLF